MYGAVEDLAPQPREPEQGDHALVGHAEALGFELGDGGVDVPRRPQDIARLSPLKHRIPNPLGRCSFTASTPAAGALRPLRDPNVPEPDEDDAGEE